MLGTTEWAKIELLHFFNRYNYLRCGKQKQ